MYAISLGVQAGNSNQGANSIAIGYGSGNNAQGTEGVAIGVNAGNISQANHGIAIGNNSGRDYQGIDTVAIGNNCATFSQGTNSVGIGNGAGYDRQGTYAVAIGSVAGCELQGTCSIAIGYMAGYTGQSANSIIINSTGSVLDASSSGCFIKPLSSKSGNTFSPAVYNPTTGELSYCPPNFVTHENISDVFTLNMRDGDYFHVIYENGGNKNIHFNDPNNMILGQHGQIILVTNGENNTVTFSEFWKFSGGILPTLSVTNTIDIINYYIYDYSHILCSYLSNVS
jgi:hypothetical protein